MEGLDYVLYKFGEVFSVLGAVVALLGLIVDIIAIIQGVRKWKERWGKKSKLIFISIVVSFFMIVAIGIGVSIRTNVLLEVPNVEGKLYKDAKAILIEHGFEFNTLRDSEENFVLKQTPEAGSIRTKKTEIVLELEQVHVHRWTPTSVKEATCILTGEVRKECVCGAVEIEVIPLTDHNWKDATCTEPKICMICEETEAEKLGHKEEILEGYAATCTTDGRTDGKECSRCGVTIEEQKTIKALGHKEVALKGYAETCTTAGLTDGIKCSRCDDVIANQTMIEATGHSYVDDGTKMYCSICGHVAATWVMVDDWTQDVLTAGIDEKIITKSATVTKYRYYSCMFWSDSSLDIVSGSEAHAQKNRTWNGVWLSDTSWKEIGENVCTGLFIVGKQGKSNGKYVRVATRWYDSPQNPMPNCIEKSPCFEEDIMQQTVTEYQRWKLVYE